MPWMETSPVKQRLAFVAAVKRQQHTITELCRRFGISRRTGHKWLARYREEGGDEGLVPALADRSRRPHRSPAAISKWLERQLVAVRKEHPAWGPKKLRAILMRKYPDGVWAIDFKGDFPLGTTRCYP